ncbi:MAG: ATP-dependent helicase [Candidatus Nanopelagicaceae bacterium]
MANAEEILAALDDEQRKVALATRGPVCVIAGAGTGKTRAITHRIAYASAIGVMDPQRVLAITFTARAAGEMRSRLRNLGFPGVNARTIHSAALKQLLYFWTSVFGGQSPELLTSKTPFIKSAVERAGIPLPANNREALRDIATEIEWAKVNQIAPEDLLATQRTVRPRVGIEQIAKIYSAYEVLKKQERTLDFEDLLLLTTAMIENEPQVRERIHDQYRYFTVDEYQDISPLQQRLIDAWLGSRKDICVVGDPAQTIYSFAGATPSFLLNFTKRFPDAEVIRLTTGYRSTPEIIFTANAILRSARMGSELSAINDHGARPELTEYKTEGQEAVGITNQITELISTGTAAESIAVLARTNAQLNLFEKTFKEAGLPYQIRSNDRFFDRPEIREFIRDIRQASVIPNAEISWIDELRGIAAPYLSGTAMDGIGAIIHLARELDTDDRFQPKTLRNFLQELEDRAQQNNPPQMPVTTLATLHAAKGLEWDRVFVVGISEGYLPYPDAIVDEELRLFYVGITRAKSHLYLSHGGIPSPFLRAISQ